MGKQKRLEAGKGSFSRGEYHAQISDEYFFPEVTKGLAAGERAILLRLTRKAMGTKDEPQLTLIVRASISYLTEFEPYRKTAVKKHLDSLEEKGFIRKIKTDHKHGNLYFVEPVYLWSDKWHQFDGIEASWLARELVAKRPTCDESISSWSEIGQQLAAKRPTCSASVGTELAGKRPQYRSRSSDPHGAVRYRSNATTGGVSGKRSEGRRCPNGQDQKGGEGVGLPADAIGSPRPHTAQLRELQKAFAAGAITKEDFQRRVEELAALDGVATDFVKPKQKNRPQKTVGRGADMQV